MSPPENTRRRAVVGAFRRGFAKLSPMSPRNARLVAVLLLSAAPAAACGSRGPLDGADPATEADAAPLPSSTGTIVPIDAAPTSTGPDLPPIVDCSLCLIGECSQPIVQCVTSPTCQAAFQCVLTQCGAGLDTACILGCAQGSPQGALQLLSILQCVTGKCGEDCTDILSQLGGGLGGGGGNPPPPTRDAGPVPPRDAGPPPRDGGPPRPFAQPTPRTREAIERAFSPWPELVTPSR